MPEVKTNFLRLKHAHPNPPYRYSLSLLQNYTLQQQDKQQLQMHLASLYPFALYQYPILLTPQQLKETMQFSFMLSRGVKISLKILEDRFSDLNGYSNDFQEFGSLLAVIMMKNTQFLYCKALNACFNPFEEVKISEDVSEMPGFSLQISSQSNLSEKSSFAGLVLTPLRLSFSHAQSLTLLDNNLLLNTSKGQFHPIQDIVRVDKSKNTIHFRNGSIVERKFLKPTKVKNYSGYSLTLKLHNNLARIKDTSKELLKKWHVEMDTRFGEVSNEFVQVGRIGFRDGTDKSLAELVYGVARNTYNHYFRNTFGNVAFDDVLQNQLFFIAPEQLLSKQGGKFIHQVQRIRQRMQLRFQTNILPYKSLQNLKQFLQMLQVQVRRPPTIHSFIIPKPSVRKSQHQLLIESNFKKVKQWFIDRGLFFHVVEMDQYRDEIDIKTVKHLSLIYTKMRINPWKIKEMPFGDKPSVVVSLDVQKTIWENQEKYSIAMICSLNLFFSKFTAIALKCSHSELKDAIFFCLKQCLQKFLSVHRTYPSRVFVFRTGSLPESIVEEQANIRTQLTSYYTSINNPKMNTLTYITLSSEHPLRIYTQTDHNQISPENVKKVQLLCHFQYQGEEYLQLQFQEPVMKLQIFQKQKDPNFIQKVLQLICKLVYGSVGNEFGKGLGFLQFGQKLNTYKDFNLDGWASMLKDGFMIFL